MQPLFRKYLDDTITAQELAALFDYFQIEHNREELDSLLQAHFSAEVTEAMIEQELRAQRLSSNAWERIESKLSFNPIEVPVRKRAWWPAIAVAASLLLVMSPFLYLLDDAQTKSVQIVKVDDRDVPPGSSRAQLISASGKVYQLNGSKEEIIVEQHRIHYKDGDAIAGSDSSEHLTLSTPKGGQYRVTLSDGTKVWLNAASSLSYPTEFKGAQREVKLTGEAYFEVAHNAARPFIVHTAAQEIRVLGTSFNVNAYPDDHRTVTTLQTGKVQLRKIGTSSVTQLHPDEQAILASSGFQLTEVDALLFSAWKDGEFRFKATPLVDALRQLERWYDLEVDYKGIPADIKVHASLQRNRKLSTVLHALERITELKFDIKGRSVKLMQ